MRAALLAAVLAGWWAVLGSADAAAQSQIANPPDPWLHRGTRTPFPAAVGEFRRTQVFEYSLDGRDASASYSLQRGNDRLLVTLYVYPTIAGLDCAATFADAKLSITQRSPGVRLLSEGRDQAPGGRGPEVAYRARYHAPAGAMAPNMPEATSEVYLHCPAGDEWLVKYRATWVGSTDFAANLDELLQAIAWPAGLG